MARQSLPVDSFNVLAQGYDSRHEELLQKHVDHQYDGLSMQYQESYERLSERIMERHQKLLQASDQYLIRNDTLMTDDLVKQFKKDLFASIKILQNCYHTEIVKLMEALRIEAESVARYLIKKIAKDMEEIWHQKRTEALKEAQRAVDSERRKQLMALEGKLQEEIENERKQKQKESQQKLQRECDEMRLRLRSKMEQEIQNAFEKEKRQSAFKIKELEAQLQSDSSSRLDVIQKEAKSALSKQILALKARYAKDQQQKEKEIRARSLDELKLSKEQEEKKALNKAKSYENRLRKEIQEDHDRYLERYKGELQTEMNVQADKAIKRFRKKLDEERRLMYEKVKQELDLERESDIAKEQNLLQQRQALEVEEFKNKLLKEREEECSRLRRSHQISICQQLDSLRSQFESAKLCWVEEIRLEAEQDQKKAIAVLKQGLEQERQQIVAALTQEIVKRRQEALQAEHAAHKQEIEKIFSSSSVSNLSITASDSSDIISRINLITNRVIQLQQQNKTGEIAV